MALGLIPGHDAICGLSLLVLYSVLKSFSPGTLAFPSSKPTFDLADLISFYFFPVSPVIISIALNTLET